MPQPTLSSVHVNQPLSNVSVAYIQDQRDFVAARTFPIVPVDKESDVYYKYNKDDWFRDEAAPRAAGTESAGSGYNLTNTATYSCTEYGLHKDIPWRVRDNSDAVLQPDRDATIFLTQRGLLKIEKVWASKFFTTSVWATDKTVSFKWDDYANSDPIGDVRAGIVAIKKVTGLKANKLTVGFEVFMKLIDHPDIIARVGGGSTTALPALVNEERLAQIFGLEEVVVCGAIENTAAENATGVYAFVQGKSALLSYSPSAAGLLVPSAGYIFLSKQSSSGLGLTSGISKFPMQQLKSDRVEISLLFDMQAIATDCGYFFPSVIS